MLEHLLSPEYDDPYTVPTDKLLAAQATTADILLQFGSPEHLLDEDEKQTARSAFAATASPNTPSAVANAAILKLRTPPAVKEPESTIYRLEPIVLIVCCTAYCAPWPIAIMITTAPTPITMPSMVSAVRRRLAPIASQASPSMAFSMLMAPSGGR